MPRRKLIRQNQFPYHVTSRSRNQEWYKLELSTVWCCCLESLKIAKEKHPCSLHSFVLMNNHYHLILTPRDGQIDQFMYEFNKNLSLKIRERSRRVNQIFGGRYKWLILSNDKILMNFLRYVYRNPVKAKMVASCEKYPFSSLSHWYSSKWSDLFSPLFEYDDYHLTWFNREPEEIEELAIGLSLKRNGEIKISKSKRNKEIYFQKFSA